MRGTMIRINQIKLSIGHTAAQLEQKIRRNLKLSSGTPMNYEIVKQSIDARKKPELFYVYSVDVTVDNENEIQKKINNNNIMLTNSTKYFLPSAGIQPSDDKNNVVIVGAGPAGLFCAYVLTLCGIYPTVIERGKCVEERTKDVLKFWETGVLDTASNVQFGEGGAGTFSDGKLNTLIKDSLGRSRFVLETFVKFGAPKRILYENKPHIGTDILADVILRMREFMQEAGTVFRFETCMTDYRAPNGKITGIEVNHSEWLTTNHVVLAIGHSARDTFRILHEKKEISMETKAFAVGFRTEHPQSDINLTQYGEIYAAKLPAAPYKVTANLENGRGVYSFCMCPGGYVVNASSEENRLAVNGMSYSGRDGKNANSAIIVSVTPQDFDGKDALAGVRFQQSLEEKAFCAANGKIPQQLFGDFCSKQPSMSYGGFESAAKGEKQLCNLRGILPEELEQSFIEGMHVFAKTIPSFDRADVILSGIESRTSSPVRIWRNQDFMSDVAGIYPCGEGAGYAGGIMSAAMDGMKIAEAICKKN